MRLKTKCPPGYQHNGFVATHALAHMIDGFFHKVSYWYIYPVEGYKKI